MTSAWKADMLPTTPYPHVLLAAFGETRNLETHATKAYAIRLCVQALGLVYIEGWLLLVQLESAEGRCCVRIISIYNLNPKCCGRERPDLCAALIDDELRLEATILDVFLDREE